jgi:hypothetical protein
MVLPKVVPEIKYTSVLFAVHTVWPDIGFGAQAFTTLGVEILVGVTLVPSTLTTETPVTGVADQLPWGRTRPRSSQ